MTRLGTALFRLLLGACGSALLGGFLAYALLAHALPGPGTSLATRHADRAERTALERRHAVDRNLLRGYLHALRNAVAGDLGRSWVSGQPVGALLRERLPRTLALVVPGSIGGILLALALAVGPGRRPTLPWSVATIVLALGLLGLGHLVRGLVCAPYGLDLCPVVVGSGWRDALAPNLILAALWAAWLWPWLVLQAQHYQHSTWLAAARARGLSGARLRWNEALYPLLAPLVLRVGPALPLLVLGGALALETVFGVAGLGRALAEAAAFGDRPVLLGISLALAPLLALWLHGLRRLAEWLDPRTRAWA